MAQSACIHDTARSKQHVNWPTFLFEAQSRYEPYKVGKVATASWRLL